MGERGLPRTWRHMNGYGSHTYMWVNAAGEKFWVKYHFHTNQGMAFFSNAEAADMAGSDADYHRRDLFEAIARGEHPSWTLSVQVMPYAEAKDLSLQPVRSDQDLAAQGLSADQGRHDDARTATRRTSSPRSSRRRSRPATRCRASACRPTRCCSAAPSPTTTRSATASAPTSTSCRSTGRRCR